MTKLKCCGCKDRFDKESMISCPAGKFHSIDCLTAYSIEQSRKTTKRRLAKVKADTNKEGKAAKAAVMELNRNTLRWQHKQTQKSFNKKRVLEELIWFKERGLDPTCISCSKPLGGDQWCNGHLKTVGAHSELRYDRDNTKLQHNMRCNMNLSGDIHGTSKTHGYLKGLIIRFGETEGQAIIDYCEKSKPLRNWTCDELEAMRKIFNERIRDLNKILKGEL